MATAPASDFQIRIGPRVRALRVAMDLSLRDLAERSGVSAPMLSQVERGETSPTLAVAARIASGLDLRLSQLLRLDEGGSVTIVRADERRRGGSPGSGHTVEVLTAPLPGPRAELRRRRPRAPPSPPPSRRGAQSGAAAATRRCTSRAAARSRWWSAARSCCT